MLHDSYTLDPLAWAQQHVGELDLGDVRRDERAVTLTSAMAAQPSASLPQLFPCWSELKAAYTFFAQPSNTPDELQATHRELVQAALQPAGVYLLPEDTTELAWPQREGISGLGPVGSSQARAIGFLLHSVLALHWPHVDVTDPPLPRPSVQLVGLAGQPLHVRQARPVGESRRDHQASLSRSRESDLWSQMSRQLGPAPADPRVRWVRVADRGADIYEFLRSCTATGHGYVVRAARDRVVLTAQGQRRGNLFTVAQRQPRLGQFALELRARPHQPARTATLSLSATRVWLRAPQRPGHAAGTLPALACTVIRVWEACAPKGVTPLEWVLLGDGERTTWPQALECVWQYATRWLCEDFHKALKTGLQVERLQLQSGAALMAATALKSLVALRLVELRERVHQQPTAPATQAGLTAEELALLAQVTERRLHTVREVALALAHLGGHLNRQRDGLPGWQTLWRGWQTLQLLLTGKHLAHARTKSKKFR